MSQKLGIVYIKVDGALLQSLPGAKIDIGGVERTTVAGGNAILGFSAKPMPAVLECEVSLGEGTSLVALGKIDNATLTFECDTGQTYVVRGAWLTNTPAATAGDGGKVPLKFEGPPADEMGL